jgi:hypothetical protein
MSPSTAKTFAAFTGLTGVVIDYSRSRPVWGFFPGFLLSLIGIVVIVCVKPNQNALVRREAARLGAQEEALRMTEAERFAHTTGPQPDQRPRLIAAFHRLTAKANNVIFD